MGEIRGEKVKEAHAKCCEIFKDLELSDEEIEILHHTGLEAIMMKIEYEKIKVDVSEAIEKQQKLNKVSNTFWLAVYDAIAIAISIISILAVLIMK